MDNLRLKLGDVVQLNENNEPCWVGCFMMVTELKSWGVQGFVSIPKNKTDPALRAYYRAEWQQMEMLHLRTAGKDDADEIIAMAHAPLVPADEIESEGV